MTVRVFFQQFEPEIRKRFASALEEAGLTAGALQLELRDDPFESKTWRAEFSVTPPNGPVRITWGGIASLWCCCQAAARLARRMFEGTRQGLERLDASVPEIETGLYLFALCQRFCWMDFPPAAEKWVPWAPRPEVLPADADSKLGNLFFYGALGWIMRHEIAHVTLQHSVVIDSIQAENDADRQATEWFRGGRSVDPNRELGARPGKPELELEFRAIATGFGLIWVTIFESLVGHSGTTHPPSAERILRNMNLLGFRPDSMAAEVLFHAIQAWLDPMGNWAPPGGYPDAMTALNDALGRLYRALQERTTSPLDERPLLMRTSTTPSSDI